MVRGVSVLCLLLQSISSSSLSGQQHSNSGPAKTASEPTVHEFAIDPAGDIEERTIIMVKRRRMLPSAGFSYSTDMGSQFLLSYTEVPK